MDCLRGEEKNLEINTIFNWESVKLLNDRCDVINGETSVTTSGPVESYGWICEKEMEAM